MSETKSNAVYCLHTEEELFIKQILNRALTHFEAKYQFNRDLASFEIYSELSQQ